LLDATSHVGMPNRIATWKTTFTNVNFGVDFICSASF
jgi:hypothetical protein